MQRHSKRIAAFTLLELMLALMIVALLSTAVATQLAGAAKTYQFVNARLDSTTQVEMAVRRIMHNVRTASVLSAPASTTASSTLTLVTQPDAANGNATYTVTYTLTAGNLTETDSRYNSGQPTVLVSNVSAFSVIRSSLTSPVSLLVNLTVGSSPVVTRNLTIYCRNI